MGTGHAGRRAVFHFCASVVHARFVHACRAGADIGEFRTLVQRFLNQWIDFVRQRIGHWLLAAIFSSVT